jgi:hypothetical protein
MADLGQTPLFRRGAINSLLPSPRQKINSGLPVDPKEDLLGLWPFLPYKRPQLKKALFRTSRKPTLKDLPGS